MAGNTPAGSFINPVVQVVEVEDIRATPRRPRRPREAFNIRYKPMEIVPFMWHPILPGESLDSAYLQSRVVSDPLANNLVGWHQSYWVFYIPLRAMAQGDIGSAAQITPADLKSLFLDTSFSMLTTYPTVANDVPFYMFKGGAKWQIMTYTYLIEKFFRDEGETAGSLLDNYYGLQIDQKNWAHSLKEESAGADDSELPYVDELEDANHPISGFTTEYAQWELLRDQGYTDLT